MSSNKSDQSVYAAGQAREFLANELSNKENRYIREFAGLIDDDEVLDWLNYRCSIYADEGDDFLDTRLARTVIRSAATRTADRAFKEGAASQLQGLVGLTNHTQDGQDLYSTVTKEYLAHEGAIGLAFGQPGSGKTASTIDVGLAWQVRTGGALIGNTEWDGFERHVETDREMLEAMAEIEGPVLAILDEIAQDLSGFGSGNKRAEAFSDALLLVRKKEKEHGPYPKKGRVLMVSQTRKKTAKPLREIASFGIQKVSVADPGRAKLLESDADSDKFEEVEEYKGLTDTAANYGEYDPSPFKIVESGDEDDEGNDVDASDVERDAAIKNALRAVKPWTDESGMKYEDAGEIVGYSETWVGNRVSEWRKGEYRDLVEDPDEKTD